MAEYVILLHGLARTARSMRRMQRALTERGYRVVNLGYPSRTGKVEALAVEAIELALAACDGPSLCGLTWRITTARPGP